MSERRERCDGEESELVFSAFSPPSISYLHGDLYECEKKVWLGKDGGWDIEVKVGKM